MCMNIIFQENIQMKEKYINMNIFYLYKKKGKRFNASIRGRNQ